LTDFEQLPDMLCNAANSSFSKTISQNLRISFGPAYRKDNKAYHRILVFLYKLSCWFRTFSYQLQCEK